jgi:toxin ParE1/3/4
LNVKFTPEAVSDLRDIHAYIAEFDPGTADRVISRIRQATDMFRHFPMLGREGSLSDTREFAIPGLPYTIVYRISSKTSLDILTIVHQRKRYPPET